MNLIHVNLLDETRSNLEKSIEFLKNDVNKFTFRLNRGDVKIHTMDRINSLLLSSFGKHLRILT